MIIENKKYNYSFIFILLMVFNVAYAQIPPTPKILSVQVIPTESNPGQVKVVWNKPANNIVGYQFLKVKVLSNGYQSKQPYPDTVFRADTFKVDDMGEAHLKSEIYSVVAKDSFGEISIFADLTSTIYLHPIVYDSCSSMLTLNWTVYDGLTEGDVYYKIWKAKEGEAIVNIGSVKDTFYVDNSLIENSSYNYYISVETSYGQSISNIQKVLVSSVSGPSKDQFIDSVWVDGENVIIKGMVDDLALVTSYDLFRGVSLDGNYVRVKSKVSNGKGRVEYEVPGKIPHRFYKMLTLGVCGEYIDSTTIVQPLFLALEQNDSDVLLKWHKSYDAYNELYYLQTTIDGVVQDEIFLGDGLVHGFNLNDYEVDNAENFVFAIKALAENQFVSLSNSVSANLLPIIKLPNAFTPNSDNLNDQIGPFNKKASANSAEYVYFENVELSSLNKFELIIYDRYGGTVFETTSTASFWDGNYGGYQLGEGAYPYYLKMVTQQGRVIEYSNVFQIVYPYKTQPGVTNE